MAALRTYRNTRTGVCIQTPCACAGEDWEEIKDPPLPAAAPSDPDSGRKPTTPKKSTKKAR